jgi:predicted RNase H-like nuclease
MALALAAKQSENKPIETLPEDPPLDSEGLRMAIHYIKRIEI